MPGQLAGLSLHILHSWCELCSGNLERPQQSVSDDFQLPLNNATQCFMYKNVLYVCMQVTCRWYHILVYHSRLYHPTQHITGHFWDDLPSRSLDVQKWGLNCNQVTTQPKLVVQPSSPWTGFKMPIHTHFRGFFGGEFSPVKWVTLTCFAVPSAFISMSVHVRPQVIVCSGYNISHTSWPKLDFYILTTATLKSRSNLKWIC